ncbi:hypothetical protein BGZ74_002965 [Mortierella antarctica]|nr:hypothetical protein BGZ74_002965 [Mortierella antarctica]
MSSPQPTTLRPTIDPLQIPEILSLVLHFTDRQTLVDCAKVSRLWRSCALPVQWQVYKVDATTLFNPALNQGLEHAHLIRALDIPFVNPQVLDTPKKALPAHPMRNLTHLTINVDPITDPQFSDPSSGFYWSPRLFVDFVLMNQGLCELQVVDDTYGLVVLPCLQQLARLKKLKMVGQLSVEDLSSILNYLGDNNTTSPSPPDSVLISSGSDVATALDELIVQVPKFESTLHILADPKLCTPPDSTVRIRALSLLNFDQRNYQEDTGDEQENTEVDILLPFLRRFPDLERLSLAVEIEEGSSKTLPIEYTKPVAAILEAIGNSYSDAESVPLLAENLGEELFKCCPKLTSLAFGPHTLLTPEQVASLSKAYAAQLQSYIMWGILHESESLVYMLTVQCLYKSPLVELDISGCGRQLGEAAWVVFRTLPNLRHFRALGVPLHAQQLVGYDWVCAQLETLAIAVLVPRRMKSLAGALATIEYDGSAAYMALQELGISGAVPSEEEVCVDDRIRGRKRKKAAKEGRKKETSKEGKKDREKKKKHKEHKEKSKKRKRKHDSDNDDDENEDNSEVSSLRGQEPSYERTNDDWETGSSTEHPCDRLKRHHTDFCAEIQVMICEQLGRLSRLRVLTLEGDEEVYSSLERVDWTCLSLTLDTGLDRLAPLQSSLETLSVYNLADRICHGREEVEWIARNWVHHQDVEEVSDAGHKILRPSPPFKNLLGVSVQGNTSTAMIHLNIAWLKDECPKLTIETHQSRVDIGDDRTAWFFSGGYQDF